MKYALIKNGIVTQVQTKMQDGFKEVNDNVFCGMVDNGDGTFSTPIKTQVELQKEVFNHFDTITRQFINDAVITFDVTNKTTFRNIEAFTKYLYNVNDVRYALAVSFLTWQSSVWDAVILQRDAYEASNIVPTDDAFLATLPAKV